MTVAAAPFRLALDHYAHQLREDWRDSLPALLLPGVGSILAWFCPPLVIAAALDAFEDGERLALSQLVPYLLVFAGIWSAGEIVWRFGIHFLNRAATRGASKLYRSAMDALLAKDVAFFHDNFAGSVTKKVTGYGSSYLILLDTLAFQVASNLLPLGFVSVVLWRYSPWLVVTLVAMVAVTGYAVAPLILRRQKLVDAREMASNELAGHVATPSRTWTPCASSHGRRTRRRRTPATSSDGGGWRCARGTTRTAGSTWSRNRSTSSPTFSGSCWPSPSPTAGASASRRCSSRSSTTRG